MKRLFTSTFAILLSALLIVGCSSETKQVKKSPEVNITTTVNPADGLDLKLVGALLQDGKVTDAASLEKEINKKGGINNLDLDGNGEVDYINVSENDPQGNTRARSFDLTTGNGDNTTFLASVEVEKGGGDTYNIHMSGSEAVYGSNAHYTSTYRPSVGQMMFYAWLFSPRPVYYHAPYYHGYYPTYYRPVTVVSRTAYSQRTVTQRTTVQKTVKKSTTPRTSTIKSSNKGKTSAKARTSINNHKKSQKDFKARDTKKSVNKGGFTKGKTGSATQKKSSTSSSSSTRPSSTSRSSSSRSSSSSYKKPTSSRSSTSSRSRSSSSRSRSSGRRSDEAYKTDVQSIENALETVLAMDGVTYYWDEASFGDNGYYRIVGEGDSTAQQVGFIAQDVETVAPLLVSEDKFGKTVNYDLTVAYLVEAIKQQQAMIQDLQSQLELQKIKQ